MYDALTDLIEEKNPSCKIALQNKMKNIKMTKEDIVATFFMKVSQLKEQLTSLGYTV
jgi:hypothetical protein